MKHIQDYMSLIGIISLATTITVITMSLFIQILLYIINLLV